MYFVCGFAICFVRYFFLCYVNFYLDCYYTPSHHLLAVTYHAYLPTAVLNHVRQVKSGFKAASACLRHCPEMVRRSIVLCVMHLFVSVTSFQINYGFVTIITILRFLSSIHLTVLRLSGNQLKDRLDAMQTLIKGKLLS